MTRALPVDFQEVLRSNFLLKVIYSSIQDLLTLSSSDSLLFSTIVPLLLSAAWLSYPDLLYYLSKDTEAAAALVREEIMELELDLSDV